MRALSSLLLAGAVALGGLALTPGPAAADGGWRGRNYYRDYVPPPPRHYGYYGPRAYHGPRGYYAPGPGYYYRPPPPAYYRTPPAYYGPPPAYYGVRPGPGVGLFGGAPGAFGVPPGPGVGLFIR